MKGKRRGRGKEKERRRGQNILKTYRVTMKIVNRKYGIVNLKKRSRMNSALRDFSISSAVLQTLARFYKILCDFVKEF